MLKDKRIDLDGLIIDLFSSPSFEEYHQALLIKDSKVTSYDIIKNLVQF